MKLSALPSYSKDDLNRRIIFGQLLVNISKSSISTTTVFIFIRLTVIAYQYLSSKGVILRDLLLRQRLRISLRFYFDERECNSFAQIKDERVNRVTVVFLYLSRDDKPHCQEPVLIRDGVVHEVGGP